MRLAHHAGLDALLSPDERKRAARMRRPGAAERWIAARAALRTVLGKRLDRAPETIVFSAGAHGKPELAGERLRFNLSHSGELALIALADGFEVGVDLERTARSSRAVTRALTDGERASVGTSHLELLQVWCRKEALAKARGTGLAWRPEAVDTTQPGEYTLVDLALEPGYLGALAAAGGPPAVALKRVAAAP